MDFDAKIVADAAIAAVRATMPKQPQVEQSRTAGRVGEAGFDKITCGKKQTTE